MNNAGRLSQAPAFYTVREAAKVLRCHQNTLYRAIHDDAFPAVRIRNRYIVPAEVVKNLAEEALETGVCVDVAKMAADRRTEREMTQATQRQAGR